MDFSAAALRGRPIPSRPFRLVVAAALAAAPLAAQSSSPRPAKLLGQIRDAESRAPIVGAEIQIVSGPGTTSDARGFFRLDSIAPGQRRLIVRRVGFAPLDTLWSFAAGDSVVRIIELSSVQSLDSVVTVDRAPRDSRMREFEAHRKLGLGTFYTRADIEKAGGQISNLMAATNGVRVITGASNQAYIMSSHGMKSIAELLPGASRCYAEVYVDDANVYTRRGSKPSIPPFDVNSIPPAMIEAIEYYSGPAETPAKYKKLDTQCGVLVIHTRRAESDRRVGAEAGPQRDMASQGRSRGVYARLAIGSAFLTTGSGRTMTVEAGVASAAHFGLGVETMSFNRSTEESGRWTLGVLRYHAAAGEQSEVGWWASAGVGKGNASTIEGFGPHAYVSYRGSGLGLFGEFGIEIQPMTHLFVTPAVAVHRAGTMSEQGCSDVTVPGTWTCSDWASSSHPALQAFGLSIGVTIR